MLLPIRGSLDIDFTTILWIFNVITLISIAHTIISLEYVSDAPYDPDEALSKATKDFLLAAIELAVSQVNYMPSQVNTVLLNPMCVLITLTFDKFYLTCIVVDNYPRIHLSPFAAHFHPIDE